MLALASYVVDLDSPGFTSTCMMQSHGPGVRGNSSPIRMGRLVEDNQIFIWGSWGNPGIPNSLDVDYWDWDCVIGGMVFLAVIMLCSGKKQVR